MDKAEARKRFLEYKRSVKDRHDEEIEAIIRGYRVMASGKQLIRLSEAIASGGLTMLRVKDRWSSRVDEVAVPRLAVCCADEQYVTLMMGNDGNATYIGYKDEERGVYGLHRSTRRRVRLNDGTFTTTHSLQAGRIEAMVPLVPPPLRPKSHLKNFHILWEAEWRAPQRTVSPKDPALLKRIGGDLFAVVSIWDLTPLEQAVLSGRTL